MLRLLEEKIATPLGPLWVICDEQFRLRAVEWEEYSERMVQLLDIHYRKEGYERISATNPGGLSDKLREYFAGNLSIIDTLPTATGGTPFQREVWKTLRTIPCGQVMHYGQLAEQLITVFTLHTAKQFFTGSIGDFQPAIGSKVHHQRIRVNRRRGHASLIGWQRRSAIWCCCCRWCRSRSGINICLRRWNNRILLRINSWCWRSYGRCLRVGCGGIHR